MSALTQRVTISPSYDLPDLNLRKAVYPNGCELPRHYHEEPRFVLVLAGTFMESAEAQPDRICRPSTLIFRPAGEKHSDVFDRGSASCISVSLGRGWLDHLRVDAIDWETPHSFDDPGVLRLASDLHRELIQRDSVSRLAVESIVLELGVVTQRARESAVSSNWLRKAVGIIRERFTEDLTVTAIAKSVSVHPVHLARAFRRQFGCAPAEHVRRLRIKRACELIESTDLPLSEVALSCGFCDQSHFSRLFKRLLGTTPAQYRRTHSRFNASTEP